MKWKISTSMHRMEDPTPGLLVESTEENEHEEEGEYKYNITTAEHQMKLKMIEEDFEENSREEEEEEARHLLTDSFKAIAKSSLGVQINEEDFDVVCTTLETLRHIRSTVQKNNPSSIVPLDEISSLIRASLKIGKEYAQACIEVGRYLCSENTVTSFKEYVQHEDYSNLRSMLSIVNGKLSVCSKCLDEFEKKRNEATSKLREVLQDLEEGKRKSTQKQASFAAGATIAGGGGASLGVAGAVVGATAAVGAIALDPLIAPLVCGVIGAGGLVAAAITVPPLVKGIITKSKQKQTYEKVIDILANLNRSLQTARENLEELQQTLSKEKDHLNILRQANPTTEQVDDDSDMQQATLTRSKRALTMTPELKAGILSDLHKLQEDMTKMVEKAKWITGKSIPSQY